MIDGLSPDLEAAYRSAPKGPDARGALLSAIRRGRRREESALRNALVLGALRFIARTARRLAPGNPDAFLEAVHLAVAASRRYDPARFEFTTYLGHCLHRGLRENLRRGHARGWEAFASLGELAESGLSTRDDSGLDPDELEGLATRLRALPSLAQRVIRGLAEGKSLPRIAAEARVTLYRVRECYRGLLAMSADPAALEACRLANAEACRASGGSVRHGRRPRTKMGPR